MSISTSHHVCQLLLASVIAPFILSCSAGGGSEREAQPSAVVVEEELRPQPVDSVDMFPWQSEARSVTRDFCLRLFRQVNASSRGENVLVSPLGAQMMLGMTANGASGNTFSEVKRTFGFSNLSINAIDAYHSLMLDSLSRLDPWVLVSVANHQWVDHRAEVRDVFRRRMVSYHTEPSEVDMSQPSEVRQSVDEWARHSTNGICTHFLPSDYTIERDQFLLGSSLYFYGLWTEKFRTPNIYRFANQNGWLQEVVYYEGPADGVVYRDDDFVMVRKSFGQRRDFSMFILLPHEGKDVDDCIKRLTVERWIALIRSRQTCSHMNIAVPKIDFDVTCDLTPYLSAMGMNDAFDRKKASFGNMSSQALSVRLAPQRLRVSLSQVGVGAEDGNYSQSAPEELVDPDISINRPFIFVITEISTGAFFYMGKVVNL